MASYPSGGTVQHYTQGTEFYSHDEAKVLAETYYNIGNDLYQSLLPKFQTQIPSQEDIWRLYPAFVNLSFSCEIILKLFYENDYGKYVLIDTAGIRRKSKVTEKIEKFSIMRTLLAIERADVCLMMIDALEGVTEQDAKIAGEAHEAGKGVIIVVNKWDEYEKETGTLEKYKKEVYNKLSYLAYAPMIFISAKTGQRVDKLFNMINNVAEQNAKRISTSVLNQVINEAIALVQPPTDKGKRLKIFYGTQVSTKPPTFVIFVNNKELFHFSYQRYLVNQLRKEFGLEGTPIRMIAREKSDKEMEG